MADRNRDKLPVQEDLNLDAYSSRLYSRPIKASARSKFRFTRRGGMSWSAEGPFEVQEPFKVGINGSLEGVRPSGVEPASWAGLQFAVPGQSSVGGRRRGYSPVHTYVPYDDDDSDDDSDDNDDEGGAKPTGLWQGTVRRPPISGSVEKGYVSRHGTGHRPLMSGSVGRGYITGQGTVPGLPINRSGERGDITVGRGKVSEEDVGNVDRVGDRGSVLGRSMAQTFDWRLAEAAPGGPQDLSLISSFYGHVAFSIWHGQERPVLRCHTRGDLLAKWRQPKDPGAVAILEGTCLSSLGNCMFSHLNMPLLSAFVERWHPETNSFHMPFGEMTITLHDVSLILRVPISGRAVTHRDSKEDVIQRLTQLLGMSFEAVNDQLQTGGIKFSTVRDRCTSSSISTTSAARGFLIYVLGASLFVDKAQDNFSPMTLSLLDDLEAVDGYAWGAAALAYLYRQLGLASRADCRQLAGCTTLLETWIYTYFPMFRPSQRVGWTHGMAHALRWCANRPSSKSSTTMIEHRLRLDNMRADEVIWTPFGQDIASLVPHSTFHGCIRYFNVIEPYMPDRVLRQFGYVQTIPQDPIEPISSYRPANSQSYKVQYPAIQSNWDRPAAHQLYRFELDEIQSELGEMVSPGSATAPDYLEWFLTRTHPRVQNSASFPQGYSTTVLHDISPETSMYMMYELLLPIHPSRRHERSEAWEHVDRVIKFLEERLSDTHIKCDRQLGDASGSRRRRRQ